MKTFLQHLNSLSPEARDRLAADCKTSVGYLRKACSAGQKFGAELCVSIEQATNGEVTRQELRPDDWAAIWPELAEKVGAGETTSERAAA
jgi:DNA-binding transcriptional regulator YdaS (Cro superfamily)